jgi:hypothetical protein
VLAVQADRREEQKPDENRRKAIWSAPAKRSGDGAFPMETKKAEDKMENGTALGLFCVYAMAPSFPRRSAPAQSGVALRLAPQSKSTHGGCGRFNPNFDIKIHT